MKKIFFKRCSFITIVFFVCSFTLSSYEKSVIKNDAYFFLDGKENQSNRQQNSKGKLDEEAIMSCSTEESENCRSCAAASGIQCGISACTVGFAIIALVVAALVIANAGSGSTTSSPAPTP